MPARNLDMERFLIYFSTAILLENARKKSTSSYISGQIQDYHHMIEIEENTHGSCSRFCEQGINTFIQTHGLSFAKIRTQAHRNLNRIMFKSQAMNKLGHLIK